MSLGIGNDGWQVIPRERGLAKAVGLKLPDLWRSLVSDQRNPRALTQL